MHWAFSSFEWSIDPLTRDYSRTEAALRSIEILAAHGARWQPEDTYRVTCLRRHLAKADRYEVIRHLLRIVRSGAIEPLLFKEVMRTPRMKDIMKQTKQTYPGVVTIREYAGEVVPVSPRRFNRRQSESGAPFASQRYSLR